MSINQLSAFPLLLKAALADSCFKLAESIWREAIGKRGTSNVLLDENRYPPVKLGTLEEHRFDRNHPYYHACDEARELCTELGRFCRKNNVDLSSSALLKDLHFKAFFSEAYEAGRVVICEVLTPKVLHDSVAKRNVLQWKGWTITAGREDECDDAYGLPTFTRPLVAKHEGGKPEIVLWMPGQESERAKEAYKLITGSPFVGDDGLEDDFPHLYERYCGAF